MPPAPRRPSRPPGSPAVTPQARQVREPRSTGALGAFRYRRPPQGSSTRQRLPETRKPSGQPAPCRGQPEKHESPLGLPAETPKSHFSFFSPKHPSLLFGLAGSQVRAGSPRGRQPAPKHNGRTWESLPSLFPSLQTRRLGRRKEFRHHVGSYILRTKQPPLFLARW